MRPFLFYAMALVIAVCDQVSKSVVAQKLTLNVPAPALGKIVFLTYTQNTGGAFSLFRAKNGFFIVIAIVAMVALIVAYQRGQRSSLIVSAAISMALGGAIGNLIDRLRYGYVIDFFDFQGGTGHNLWPIFNVADSAITVGIVLLALHFLFSKETPKENAAEARINSESSSEHATPNQ